MTRGLLQHGLWSPLTAGLENMVYCVGGPLLHPSPGSTRSAKPRQVRGMPGCSTWRGGRWRELTTVLYSGKEKRRSVRFRSDFETPSGGDLIQRAGASDSSWLTDAML